MSETLKLRCQSAICNLGGLRTVCNAFSGLRDPEETLLPATVQLYSYYEGTIYCTAVLVVVCQSSSERRARCTTGVFVGPPSLCVRMCVRGWAGGQPCACMLTVSSHASTNLGCDAVVCSAGAIGSESAVLPGDRSTSLSGSRFGLSTRRTLPSNCQYASNGTHVDRVACSRLRIARTSVAVVCSADCGAPRTQAALTVAARCLSMKRRGMMTRKSAGGKAPRIKPPMGPRSWQPQAKPAKAQAQQSRARQSPPCPLRGALPFEEEGELVLPKAGTLVQVRCQGWGARVRANDRARVWVRGRGLRR
eukprot:COSAG01_NODE_975_length_12366_cov_20.561833_4_plen_306_part_00